MRRKTRSSAKVLRWKASGPPSGTADGPSPGAMELVQQELPLKEGTAGLRVITVIVAVMVLHVLFIGGIALFNLLGGGGKSVRTEDGGPKGSGSSSAYGARPVGSPTGEAVGAATPPSSADSLLRSRRGKGKTDSTLSPSAEETGGKKGGRKRLRRVSSKEGAGQSSASEAAPVGQQIGEAGGGTQTVSLPVQSKNERTNLALPASGASRIYHVARGDTLWRIARRFHVGLADLMAVNQLAASSKLHIGQELRIPAAKPGRSRRNAEATDG